MSRALTAAETAGHGAVILLGDAPYYARFGFSALKTGGLSLPGPFERDRLLGLELREGGARRRRRHDRSDRRGGAETRARRARAPRQARRAA